jgi:hypothetical protein
MVGVAGVSPWVWGCVGVAAPLVCVVLGVVLVIGIHIREDCLVMRKLKLFGVAFAAVFVFGVITVASASAATTALPEWSPPSAGTATTGVGKLNLEGAVVTCQTSEGNFTAGTSLGTFKVDFKTCTEAAGPCTGLGQTTGLIEVHGEWHLVRLVKSPLHFEILLLFGPDNGSDIHFECETTGSLFLIWDGILGLIIQLTPHTAELHFSTEGAGVTIKEANREYLNNAGENITLELKGKIGSGTERVAGITEEKALLFSATATTIKLP